MKNIVLKLSEKKSVFSQAFEICEYEDLLVVNVKAKSSAIRKIARKEKGKKIIIPNGDYSFKIYENKIKEYCQISNNVAFATINKICRQTAEKFGLKLPYDEIYIMATPQVACSFISKLNGLSRLFTVIYPQEGFGKLYDELYFKYGSIIRHLPCFNNDIKKDTLIIRCNSDEFPKQSNVPVIDMCGDLPEERNVVSLRRICVCDKGIEDIQKQIGGKSGASLYTLFEKIPGKNVTVDINLDCDKIFLLDTDVF